MNINWTGWVNSNAIMVVLTFIIVIMTAIMVLPVLDIRPADYFHENSYEIFTLVDPLSPELLPNLQVSPIYYVEVSADVPKTTEYNKDARFTITTIDKGKNHIFRPKLRAFVVDSVGNIRGILPYSDQNISGINISFNKKLNLIFHDPPLDQKIIGTWKLYIYIYDYNMRDLASYGIYEFTLTEGNRTISSLSWLLAILAIISTFMSLYTFRSGKYKGSVDQKRIEAEAVNADRLIYSQNDYQFKQNPELEKEEQLQSVSAAAPSSDINDNEEKGGQKAK
jgi:hypothetical protein